MKKYIYKTVAFCLIAAIIMISPLFLVAQEKIAAELTFTKNSTADFVSVNGEQIVSGRSIVSPSEIATSSQANAKIVIPQTGTVLLAPNSKMNLSFTTGGISGSLLSGEATVQSSANTSLNVQTPDGLITFPNSKSANIVKITIANGATKVQTLVGQSKFNDNVVPAGEFYPVNSGAPAIPAQTGSAGYNPLLIFGLIGAAAAVAIVALTASSDDNNSVVSPVR